jgi:hypothetical protein
MTEFTQLSRLAREKGQKESQCFRVGVAAYWCFRRTIAATLALPLQKVNGEA